jgi:hypothetical protein
MPAAQDIVAGAKAQAAPAAAAGDPGVEKGAAMPFAEALKLLYAVPDGGKKKNSQEETAGAAPAMNFFPVGIVPVQLIPADGGEFTEQAALQEAEAVVESLAGKAGGMRQALLGMKQPAVLPEEGIRPAPLKTAVGAAAPEAPAESLPLKEVPELKEVLDLKEVLAPHFAPAPKRMPEQALEQAPEKSVNARELFGDRLVVIKDAAVLPPGDPLPKAPAEKAVSAIGAPVLAAPAENKKAWPTENVRPELAAPGEKIAPDFAVKAPGRIEEAGRPTERSAPAKAAAPLSLKLPAEEAETAGTEVAAQTETAAQTAGQEPIAANAPAKDSFAQKLHFAGRELDVRDTQDLANHLVEQAKLTQRPGSTEMTIRLRPQNLGEMTVRIIAENGGAISAAFHSNNSEVRGILQEALPAIRQELSGSGLKVHDVGVYAGLGDFHSFAQNQPGSQPEGKANKIGRLRLTAEEQTPAEAAAYEGETQSGTGGVDYRV